MASLLAGERISDDPAYTAILAHLAVATETPRSARQWPG
jgi:hypothetical protein